MPANVNETSLPVPDPSERSSQEVRAASAAERDYTDGKVEALSERLAGMVAVLEERLAGIDKATEVLNQTVNRVPTETQVAIGAVRELYDEKFNSVDKQFRANQTALDAALQAQKEAAGARDESNQKAIDKSEQSTSETITKEAEARAIESRALRDKLDDVTRRLDKLA
jgi:hypothetical protein